MKKNLLLTFLCLTSGVSAGNQIKWAYIVVNGQRQSIEHLVDISDLQHCLDHNDIEQFKRLETLFADNHLSFFRVRIFGDSLLNRAILSHYESCPLPFNSKEKSDAFIDYVLSRVSKEDLNEHVITDDMYWGTAAVKAALHSPYCLTKILAHPYFDASLSFDSKSKIYHLPNGTEYRRHTPQSCIEKLESDFRNGKESKELIRILKAKFNL